MIDFSNVRIEKNKTHTFITSTNTRFIKWAFEDAGITDYQITSLIKIRKQLPKDVIIPDFIPSIPGEKNVHACRNPFVVVSHMNADDLDKKIIEIYAMNDPDLKKRVVAEQTVAQIDYEQNHKPYIDDNPLHTEVL